MARVPRLALVGVFLSLLIAGEALAAVEMGIITGREKGTYYRFGLDIKQLAAQHGINLNVYPSNGSIENIHSVYRRPRTQLGIVQSDVLASIKRFQTGSGLRGIADKIKIVLPLYDEEVHVVVRKGIEDFDDLEGRVVAMGEEGSGTLLTASLLFEVSRVKPREMVTMGTGEALAELKAGKIDAMFYVAGCPVRLFEEDVSAEDDLDIIPITNADVLKFYPKGEIPGGAYPWKADSVPTVTVKALMVSYDFAGDYCGYVGDLAVLVHRNLSRLIENGHPKWQSVDFAYVLKGWEQYDCVTRALQK